MTNKWVKEQHSIGLYFPATKAIDPQHITPWQSWGQTQSTPNSLSNVFEIAVPKGQCRNKWSHFSLSFLQRNHLAGEIFNLRLCLWRTSWVFNLPRTSNHLKTLTFIGAFRVYYYILLSGLVKAKKISSFCKSINSVCPSCYSCAILVPTFLRFVLAPMFVVSWISSLCSTAIFDSNSMMVNAVIF